MPQPFIVTAELPVDLFSWANGLRTQHFPPERNWLKAHVTLFHSFAPSLREELRGMLGQIAAAHPPPRTQLDGLMDLGSGTAIALRSPAMLAIREEIAEHFHGALTAQDAHPPRLHITIQNKVSSDAARRLQRELRLTPPQHEFQFTGLGLHLYTNPHWEEQQTWRFRGRQRG